MNPYDRHDEMEDEKREQKARLEASMREELSQEALLRVRRRQYGEGGPIMRSDKQAIEGDPLVGAELDLDPDRTLHVHNPLGTGANARQVGGDHYGLTQLQHWDICAIFKLDYFQGQVTKYIMRWRDKNGIEDLEKAKHYLEKYIEVERSRISVQIPLPLEPEQARTALLGSEALLDSMMEPPLR